MHASTFTNLRRRLSLRATAGTVLAGIVVLFALAIGSGSSLASVLFDVPQKPILEVCNGTKPWDVKWKDMFVDASRNCDDDLTRAGLNGPDGVDAMDFDGDCDQDLITGWEENGRVFVYLNPRLRQRPGAAGDVCPKTYPAATDDDLWIEKQWPFTEITRDDTDDSRPFRGVEDAIFVDNNADNVADYVVISTEIGSTDDGRREVFVSVPSDGSSTNESPPTWKWTTFKLTGEENYMRSTVGDIDDDGCLDIIAGSKTAANTTGDIRWWRCPGAAAWKPQDWKKLTKASVPDYRDLRERWGTHRLIATEIHWVMELIVADLESTEIGGKNYPELVFTDRKTVGYFRVSNPASLNQPSGWQLVNIDTPGIPGDAPFRWLDLGQLVKNGVEGADGPPEIVAAYNDPSYRAVPPVDRGIFARWYELDGGVWKRNDVILDGAELPWGYEKDNTNKATALADVDGDGQNEIVATIRGIDYSSVFYLTPRPGLPVPRCADNCRIAEQWLIHRVSPHFTGGEVKADNLALVDADLDCDVDVFSVDENFGINQRGMGVSWYANPVPQQSFPCNATPRFVAPNVSDLTLAEGQTGTRDFTVADSDDDPWTLTVTLAPGSPGQIVEKDQTNGIWTWRDTAVDGVSSTAPPPLPVQLNVSDGWAHGTATITFGYYRLNVAPTITQLSADPASVLPGQATTIVVGSSDPAGPADSYACHVGFGDGTAHTQAAPGGSCSMTHAYAAPGSYTVSATVFDEDGGLSPAVTRTVAVINPPPVVQLPTITPTTPGPLEEGDAVTAAATFADEAPAGPYTCVVDFGDGTVVAGAASANACTAEPHVYADDGTFEVTVAVTDVYGVTGRATAPAAVANVAPAVTAVGDAVDENGTATIGGLIIDPGSLDSFMVVVSWGDGRTTTAPYPAGTSAWSASIQYLDDDPTGTPADVYPVTVTVRDDGDDPGSASTQVRVSNVAPSVSIDSATDEVGNAVDGTGIVLEHTAVTVGASLADVGTRDMHTAVIDWGDGTVDSPAIASSRISASHTYATPGARNVAVTITDDDTESATSTVQIEVVDAAGAVAHVVAELRDRLDDPATSPERAAAIRRALADLEGPQGGLAAGGALDLIAHRAWKAALVKLRKAVDDLDAEGLRPEARLLALSARSLLVDLIESATGQPAAAAEAKAIIDAIDPTSSPAAQIDACERALIVLRAALG